MSEYTVGIEEEYQLIDPGTGELRSRARAVLAGDWSGEIRQELQESTIEIGTRVCAGTDAARAEVLRLRMQAATAAAAEDLGIVAAGIHPYSAWRGHELTAGDRYARMARQYGRLARDEHIYGTHIHVAPPAGLDRIRIMNAVRAFAPHLLALSCSSPFHEGEDTGFASYRMVLWRRWPGAGLPPRLESDAEYRGYVRHLIDAGLLDDERSLYWLIRRHPEYPTIEFRMCDACPSARDAIAIAGLARCVVAAAAEGALCGARPAGLSEAAADALLADDVWRAARYGLDAGFAACSGPDAPVQARTAVGRLLDRLAGVGAALRETAALDDVARLLERGNATDRMREVQADGTDMRDIVQWLAAETLVGAGMDRRSEQRRPLASRRPPRLEGEPT